MKRRRGRPLGLPAGGRKVPRGLLMPREIDAWIYDQSITSNLSFSALVIAACEMYRQVVEAR